MIDLKKENKEKREIFIPTFTLLIALIFFLLGLIPACYYRNLEKECTAEIKGTVVFEYKISSKYPDRTHPAHKYRMGTKLCDIDVESDGVFKYDSLSAGADIGDIGDEVLIRYNPENPGEYYFPGYYTNGTIFSEFAFVVVGLNIVLSVIFFIYYNIPHRPKNKKEDE